MIEVKDLHKTFKQQEVLKGISFKVEKGETVSIIGPSGSGKSTFIKMLLKEIEPTMVSLFRYLGHLDQENQLYLDV